MDSQELLPDTALTGGTDGSVTRATEVNTGVAVDGRHARGDDVVLKNLNDTKCRNDIFLHNYC